MKVDVKGKLVLVGWRYENPELEQYLSIFGIDEKEAREMNEPNLIDAINAKVQESNKEHALDNEYIKELPKPHTTHCILRNESGEILYTAKVNRHYKDEFSKDKARRYSLNKALLAYYPNYDDNRAKTLENKQIRRKFWETYINRSGRDKMRVVPLIKGSPSVTSTDTSGAKGSNVRVVSKEL